MPTDEQLREQFDAFVYERTVNRNMSGPWPTPTELAWLAWQARDAEVQALREQNQQYYDLLLVVALANDGHGWLNPDVSDRIDAALAGGETGETE